MNQKEHTPIQASWFLIAMACLLLLLSFGYQSCFGLFVKPITDAHGWGHEVISMALAIQNLFWGVVAAFAGGLWQIALVMSRSSWPARFSMPLAWG